MMVKRGEVWRKPSVSAGSGLKTGNGFSSGAATQNSACMKASALLGCMGMASLLRPSKKPREDHHRSLPVPMRQLIVDLKAEYPDFSLREIADICHVQFDRRPSHNTVKRVLADGPPPSRTTHQYALSADIPDPAERRLAVIRLHATSAGV